MDTKCRQVKRYRADGAGRIFLPCLVLIDETKTERISRCFVK